MLILLLSVVHGFYLPGVAPRDYKEQESLDLYVVNLDSSATQLPFSYYFLNFCKPRDPSAQSENLGQILTGERIEKSAYQLQMGQEKRCEVLCTKQNTPKERKDFKWMIDNKYRASWVLDNLPSGFRITSFDERGASKYSYYQDGFPIGFKLEGGYYINNHVNIVVQVHQTNKFEEPTWRVVGFLVEPLSMLNSYDSLSCNSETYKNFFEQDYNEEVLLKPDEITEEFQFTYLDKNPPQPLGSETIYTYSVTFEDSPNKWASRWDYYLYSSSGNEVHWLGIINSFAMVLFLSGMVAHIIKRSLNRDVNTYNENMDSENDSGWKQIRGDVFRPPQFSGIFAVIIGNGVQTTAMLLFTIVFACLGFLSPTHRGALLTAMLWSYVLMGIFGGYSSARLYKSFGGELWKRCALATSIVFPGLCFGVFFVINLFSWMESSSGAVPFVYLLVLLLLWFGVSMPLVFLGASLGFKKPSIQYPCLVNKIPKPLAENASNSKLKSLSVLAGSLPFGCMFIELSYVMKSLWHHTLFYYLFGFLFLCFIVLIITSAEVSVLMTYILLCKEDYRWWWLSFAVAGSSGLYLFGYSVVYYLLELNIVRLSSIVLYFGYMFLASCGYALVTGTVGFLATFAFVRNMYSLIKLD